MVEVAKFTQDAEAMAMWMPAYEQRLKALVDQDKAERWSAATMAVDVA